MPKVQKYNKELKRDIELELQLMQIMFIPSFHFT